MKKPILILTAAACGIALGAAATFWSDLQSERTRANRLTERVALLEPVERSSASPASNKTADEAHVGRVGFVAEPPQEVAAASKPALTGSAEALQQVARLQAALVHGTPLQDYQAQALAAAIDHSRTHGKSDMQSRARLRQAAADILFESQFETFVELVETDAAPAPR
jgi:hypothetical protein